MRFGSSFEALRDLSAAIWTLRSTEESAKILRTTTSLLRCFLFFDVCYLLAGIAMIVVGMTSEYYDRGRMLFLGGMFGAFASISSVCNSMASHGLRSWRRGFLVPWLMFYLVLLCLLVMILAHSLYFETLQLKQVFLFFLCVSVFSCWRHMHKQFMLMLYPRPEQVVMDVEAVVRDYLSTAATTSTSPAKDLPPKYEELEDLPPQYDPQTMGATPLTTTATTRPK